MVGREAYWSAGKGLLEQIQDPKSKIQN